MISNKLTEKKKTALLSSGTQYLGRNRVTPGHQQRIMWKITARLSFKNEINELNEFIESS